MPGTDSSGQDKAYARTDHGTSGMYRLCFSAVGIYQPFAEFAGAGASVPLLGFGNILWKGMKESIDKNGLIGLFMGGFTACAVGVSAALIFSYLASLIFQTQNERITYHE